MAKNYISEDEIEQAILQRLQHLHGFDVLECYTAQPAELNDGSKRKDKRDVILSDRLKSACVRLNPGIPEKVIDGVVDRVMDRRGAMSALAANRELDSLIRDGVAVEFEDSRGNKQHERVRLMDFDDCSVDGAANDYLAVSQLWIKSIGHAPKAAWRRPDIILYVNGLPLVFIELKNSNVKLRSAFDDNLANYKNDIPQLFHCNAFCVLSNAIGSRVGSFTAGWEHFFNWQRVDDLKTAALLDESVVVENAEKFAVQEHQADYQIVQKGKSWDLSKIDFEKLKEDFKQAEYKNIEIADMRAFIEEKLSQMIEQNQTRTDFAQKFQEIIDRYNSGASSTENYYEEMVKFTEGLKKEDERHIREGLTEDELEIYDAANGKKWAA